MSLASTAQGYDAHPVRPGKVAYADPLTGRSGQGLFIYLALRKDRANLAMARHQLRAIEQHLDV